MSIFIALQDHGLELSYQYTSEPVQYFVINNVFYFVPFYFSMQDCSRNSINSEGFTIISIESLVLKHWLSLHKSHQIGCTTSYNLHLKIVEIVKLSLSLSIFLISER